MTAYWSPGPFKTANLIKAIADKQVVFPLEEVPSTMEPKQSKTSSVPQSKACGVDVKPTKLSLSLIKPYRHSHHEPQSNGLER